MGMTLRSCHDGQLAATELEPHLGGVVGESPAFESLESKSPRPQGLQGSLSSVALQGLWQWS